MSQKRFYPAITALLVLVAGVTLAGADNTATAAQIPTTPPPPPDTPQFQLPFNEAIGLSTWYVVQWYGNTTFAYHYREKYYEAGQGMHFGLDFAAPCGTEIVAIGDGIVMFRDSPRYGSGPHNLLIDHGNGFVSLYGHLLEPSSFAVGDTVNAGHKIGLTGDPDITCTSRPHLHLEIRNDTYHYAYNPVIFIDADWNTIALYGPAWEFQRDLDNPHRWVTPFDQPPVDFWSPMLNDFLKPWPPDWSQ